MQVQKYRFIALFLCVFTLQLASCAAQEDTPTNVTFPPAKNTVAPALPAEDEVEALMSLGELKPAISLRGFTSRVNVYLPLQFALRAEPALQELTLAKQKTSALMMASNAADVAQMLHAVNIGFANSVHSPTTTALMGASIAFEVLDSLFGATSDRDLIKEQIRLLHTPSLYLISLKKPNPDVNAVEALKQHFGETTQTLAMLDLQCEPLQVKNKTFFTGKQLPRGFNAPGTLQSRQYICGYPSPMSVGGYRQEVEKRQVEVNIFPKSTPPTPYDGGSLATISLTDLSSTKGIKRVLDADEKLDEEDLPQLAFERVKGKLGSSWFAIYTVKSNDKKRHVVVVQGEQQVEMVLPEMR